MLRTAARRMPALASCCVNDLVPEKHEDESPKEEVSLKLKSRVNRSHSPVYAANVFRHVQLRLWR